MTPTELESALRAALDARGAEWFDAAMSDVAADPARIRMRFPAAGRFVGRAVIAAAPAGDPAPWTADDAARVLLLLRSGSAAADEVGDLHRYGDADEQRAVVRSLHLLPPVPGGRELVLHASRTNDPRLIRVALGPYGLAHLDDEEVAQVALKLVFNAVPLTCIDGLAERATPRMARMLAEFALERVAAGRQVAPDIWPFIEPFAGDVTDVLAALEAERQHAVPERRAAAEAALAARPRSS